MNSEQLQRAVDAYLANGGVIRECVAPEPPPLDPNVVAQLKACAHVTEAARKLNMNTRTVNKLARITDHEAAEAKRKEQERERIAAEERAKLEAQARQAPAEERRQEANSTSVEAAAPQQPAPTTEAPQRLARECVQISLDEYTVLKDAQRQLIALLNGGVCNWEGYAAAMEQLEQEAA